MPPSIHVRASSAIHPYTPPPRPICIYLLSPQSTSSIGGKFTIFCLVHGVLLQPSWWWSWCPIRNKKNDPIFSVPSSIFFLNTWAVSTTNWMIVFNTVIHPSIHPSMLAAAGCCLLCPLIELLYYTSRACTYYMSLRVPQQCSMIRTGMCGILLVQLRLPSIRSMLS